MNTALAPRSLTHAELESALAAVRIPAYPAVVAEVMREAQKDDPQVKVLSRIIASDVGMSAMAVKLANSPLLGGASPVKSVQQAVARLGTSNILNVVIAVALRNSTEGLPEDLMARFWARTSTLALATGVLARKHVGISPELAYTYALFHDAAIPVMMLNFPRYTDHCGHLLDDPEALSVLEREHFKCDHAVVGWLLARNWGLPDSIAAAIRYHHDPDLGSFFSNSKPTLPSSPRTRKAENLRLVRLETKPLQQFGAPVSSSLCICSRSIGCCRMILPERKSQDSSGPTDFSQT
jgi:HD-like signal output (HDOD) protein